MILGIYLGGNGILVRTSANLMVASMVEISGYKISFKDFMKIGLLVMIFAMMGGELQDATTDTTAIGVINDTTVSISSVTDWFPIFIVIGAMVVLILLTVIIITAIRGSGLMGGSA